MNSRWARCGILLLMIIEYDQLGPLFNIKMPYIVNLIVDTRRSKDHLISTVGYPILVRRGLYIENFPRFRKKSWAIRDVLLCNISCGSSISKPIHSKWKVCGPVGSTDNPPWLKGCLKAPWSPLCGFRVIGHWIERLVQHPYNIHHLGNI